MKKLKSLLICVCALSLIGPTFGVAQDQSDPVSPAWVGWSNLIVPGLGATVRGEAGRGLIEASTEIGLYYGGTFYAKEGAFTIDGSVLVPNSKNISKPLLGQVMQETGLKLHMYNTFYHYQQASLHPFNADHMKEYQQPLYMGDWWDTLVAPFRLKNLKDPWVYLPIALSTGYLIYSYKKESVLKQNYRSSIGDDALYGVTEGLVIPIGSSFGEEVLFRGFIQREVRLYTNSAFLAIAAQSLLFTAMHPKKLKPSALAGGILYGLATNHFDGDLEPNIASHFWIDCINGLVEYLTFRRVQGKSVPLSAQITIPF